MKASENGHEEIVKMLLSAGANVDVQDVVSIIACENMGVCKGEEIVDEVGLWEERAGSGPVSNPCRVMD